MKKKTILSGFIVLIASVTLATGASAQVTPTATPTRTPLPTITPRPTNTPRPATSARPTNTPRPTPTQPTLHLEARCGQPPSSELAQLVGEIQVLAYNQSELANKSVRASARVVPNSIIDLGVPTPPPPTPSPRPEARLLTQADALGGLNLVYDPATHKYSAPAVNGHNQLSVSSLPNECQYTLHIAIAVRGRDAQGVRQEFTSEFDVVTLGRRTLTTLRKNASADPLPGYSTRVVGRLRSRSSRTRFVSTLSGS